MNNRERIGKLNTAVELITLVEYESFEEDVKTDLTSALHLVKIAVAIVKQEERKEKRGQIMRRLSDARSLLFEVSQMADQHADESVRDLMNDVYESVLALQAHLTKIEF